MRIFIWRDTAKKSKIDETAGRAFDDIMRERPAKETRPAFTRIAGQSGAGKSTQVLPAVLSAETPSAVVAVRNFVKYLPKDRANQSREQTNGFCLRVLTEVLYRLISARVSVVLDMTLLSPAYERRLLKRLKKNNYSLQYFVLAVPKTQSDIFIKKRETETGRAVARNSASFFDKVLLPSLRYTAKAAPDTKCTVWSAYDLEPIFVGDLKSALPAVIKAKSALKTPKHSESEMLNAKIKFLSTYIRGS